MKQNNMSIINRLHFLLNQFKDFTTGFTTSNRQQMIIQHENEVYKVTFEKLENVDINNAVNELKEVKQHETIETTLKYIK